MPKIEVPTPIFDWNEAEYGNAFSELMKPDTQKMIAEANQFVMLPVTIKPRLPSASRSA